MDFIFSRIEKYYPYNLLLLADETVGDIEKAVDVLREKGLSKAAKKSGRIAAMGLFNGIFLWRWKRNF